MSIELIILLVIGGIGMFVQVELESVFKEYSKIPSPGNLTGREIAEKMLRDNHIYDVTVTNTPGKLTDHFNPINKTVNLSESVYNTASVSAAAVAAHECGHAIQHAAGYAPLKMRSKLVPVVQFSSMWAQIVILIGAAALYTFPSLSWVFWLGITMFAIVFIFSVITLPVEYDASRRALAWLNRTGTVSGESYKQAKKALSWAAYTYVVAALSALATLMLYLSFSRDNE